ncbi:uncharacterized protein LOC143274939 [Babylonia areolata]|uniref:uncharacterized protein LOC143274939 n=1 Tax=Babylonia areolata TaxID=304850 RepID=UPI003FD12CA1
MLLVFLFAMIGLSMAGPFPPEQPPPDCNQLPNGVVWLGGCGSFGVCDNGQYRQIDCLNGTVVDPRNVQCVPRNNAAFPCNVDPASMDCSAHVNNPGYRLPFTQQAPDNNRPPCSYYYTCSYGVFLAFQWCPDGTVYDEGNQRCSEPNQVPPPCGIASPTGGSNPPRPFPPGRFNQNQQDLYGQQVPDQGGPLNPFQQQQQQQPQNPGYLG